MRLWHQGWVWLAVLLVVSAWVVRDVSDERAASPPDRESTAPRRANTEVARVLPAPRAVGDRHTLSAPDAGPAATAAAEPVPLGDWETFQRDARHTGHVPARFEPDRFVEMWRWQRPEDGGVIGGINAVATAPGYVAVSDVEYFGNPVLRVLREVDGSLVWQQAFEDFPALNPPAVKNGAVYVTTTGHEQTFLWAFGVEDGVPIIQNDFSSQWPSLLAPTLEDGRVFVSSGYFNEVVYAFDAVAGDRLWSSSTTGGVDMSTPAVDAGRVIQYDGSILHAFDAVTGTPLVAIADLESPGASGSYHGAPLVGHADSVTTFSGGAFSGRASSSAEHYEARHLVNFSLSLGEVRWRTSRAYMTHPARANGVIYAASNSPKSFDAIDEATGRVLWSWVPGPGDLSFHRNVVVTDNLVFVSTNRAVHALDLQTRRPVWSYPVPGMLAISSRGTLYITEGATESTGRLIAISLDGHHVTGGRGARRRW